MMELSELKVFLRVSAERSFSRAATKLHRTQPAVSQAVKRLEESVGERLFAVARGAVPAVLPVRAGASGAPREPLAPPHL